MIKLRLVDTNPALVSAWQSAFADLPEVSIQHENILSIAHNSIVSPANSYGFMDGGTDRAYRRFFGKGLEARVQEAIARRPEGLLPVGASLIVGTGHVRIPFLIVAPTMVSPERVGSENCYRAMRAVLRIVSADAEVSRAVFCPGLGTGVGAAPAEMAAREMAQAYRDWRAAQTALSDPFSTRFEAAIASARPADALRALAEALKAEGMSQNEMRVLFDHYRALHDGDVDETLYNAILDTMDLIIGWCPPPTRLFDRET